MSFWDVLLRRPCPKQLAHDDQSLKLKEAINDHHKALEKTREEIERVKQTTTSLEVAAQALAAVVRGQKREHKN